MFCEPSYLGTDSMNASPMIDGLHERKPPCTKGQSVSQTCGCVSNIKPTYFVKNTSMTSLRMLFFCWSIITQKSLKKKNYKNNNKGQRMVLKGKSNHNKESHA